MARIYFLFVSFFLLFFEGKSKTVNVLLFILDDLRPALGCYLDTNAYSPNIDKLALGSIIFNKAFAQQALCAPSRNSFLTSRRPDTLHLYDFYNYWREFVGNFTTLPQYFKENGYESVSIGKIFHPGVSSNKSDDSPYSWSRLPFHPKTEIYKNAKVCFTKGKPFPQKNLVCPVDTNFQPERTLPDIESSNKAIQFLLEDRSEPKPFFLAVGFHKPHIPLKYPKVFKKHHPVEKVVLPLHRTKPHDLPDVAWNPWTDIRERDDIKELNISFPFGYIEDDPARLIKQSYYAAISYVDDLIGKILNSLNKKGYDKNTIVALIGDHGWSLGEHGEWSKYSNFDVSTRVPFILKVPGLTDNNKWKQDINSPLIISEPVELLDLFPTLVDAAGLRSINICNFPNKEILCTQGKSLIPLIMDKLVPNNEKISKYHDAFALSQYPRPGLHPTKHPNSDKPKLKEIRVMGCSLRTRRYRYTEWLTFQNLSIVWDELKATELYDHHIDPSELVNFAESSYYMSVKKKLRKMLKRNWYS